MSHPQPAVETIQPAVETIQPAVETIQPAVETTPTLVETPVQIAPAEEPHQTAQEAPKGGFLNRIFGKFRK